MPEPLEVQINRDGPHSIAVATPSFETDGPFDILLENHGRALHVHLRLDDALSAVARLRTPNHYVEEDRIRRVRVDVPPGAEPTSGQLQIVTGYGSESATATVAVVEPGKNDKPGVRVDERLGKPRPQSDAPALSQEALPVVALGSVAVLAAAVTALVFRDGVVLFGLLVVLVGMGVAVALLAR